MELLQLEYFRAIATYGSMSQAARMLFVSQPTLSVTMTRLEESLGFSLFIRQKGKLTLTPAGLRFLECAERILEDLDTTVSAIRADTSGVEESIRVVSSLNDLLDKVMENHYSDLRHLHIYERYCDNEQISKYVAEKLADWGIVYGPAYALHLHHSLLHQCDRVFVMREGHPLLHHDKMPVDKLASQTYLCNQSRDEKDVLAYCGRKFHFVPRVGSECDDCVLEMHVLNATDHVSTMPLLTYLKLLRMKPGRPLRFLYPDFELPPVQTFLIRRHESPLSPYSSKLAEYIKAFLDDEDRKLKEYIRSGTVID